MKQLIKRFKQLTILFLAIAFIGCEDDKVVLPEVVAGFTYTINEDTRTVTFINISDNAHKFEWDLGNGTNSTLINPINTYAIGAYTIVLTATNVAGDSDTFEDTIIFLDQDVPLITLIGNATINLTLGDEFTDPGATALDEVDGDLTANIVVGGDTVDTDVEGTYIITYDVTDAQGNEAIQVERTVIVTAISCTAETEGSLSASDLNLTFLNDPTTSVINDGANFSWIDNPDIDNTVNTSCKVGQITKLGNNPWDNNQIDLDAKLDFNANEGLKIKVWSPLANSEVRIKLEEIGNPGNNVEQFLTTNVTSGWEELEFPFTSDDSNKFNKVVIFFDLNANNTDTYYFDDLMLYGTGSGGGGSSSGDYLYATSEAVTIPSTIEDWGSGTTIVTDYSGDGTYNPCIQLTSGTGWGDVSALAFTAMEVGILSNYSTLEFKIKTSDYTTIKVKVPENEITFNIADGTALADGWVQMSLPLSNWSGEVAAADQFAILEFGAGTILITDVMLSGDGSGGGSGGGGDCPAPPAGEFLSNGDFEAGESCWQLFDGASISTTVSNGGSNSAEIQGATGVARGIKQERFAAGSIQPNTSYTVTFDIIADGEFGAGGLMKAFTFSEGADGGTVGATQHVLTDSTTSISTSGWETMSFTFTTPGNANQVEGGLSFLIELVNSSAKLNIDNVSVALN